MNNKLQSTVSLCRRAGKLQLGFDQVKDGVTAGDVKAVFVTADLSEKSKKEVCFFCSRAGVEVFELPLSKDEVKAAVSKGSGVLGLCDEGLAGVLKQSGTILSAKEERSNGNNK